MKSYERAAERLFKARWFPDTDKDVSLRHFEKEDILVLVDRRMIGERHDREWCGFRNYLYGYDCKILAERSSPDYAVMLIDASHDMHLRLAREFWLLTIHPRPEMAHSVWGRVAVENGKPIGLYDGDQIVRQPIKKHWSEYCVAVA